MSAREVQVESRRLINVFWGDGKGKTSAAMGMALRALGQGLCVHLVPFLKSPQRDASGEILALRTFRLFSIAQTPDAIGWVDGIPDPTTTRAWQQVLAEAAEVVASGSHDLVILDEVLYALNLGVFDADAVLQTIGKKSPQTELVLTGGWDPVESVNRSADLVTEMKKLKHPFDHGIGARRGFEY
jgi:cob(I)alamin adenosyltransferase